MTLSSKLIVICAAIGAVACFAVGYIVHQPKPIGADLAHQDTQRAQQVAASVDTAWQTQYTTLTKTIARYDTVHDSIRIHDTVWVKQFITACDSMASSCRAFRDTTALLRAADSSVIAAQQREMQQLHDLIPSRTNQVMTAGKSGLMGAGLTYLLTQVIHP